MHRNENLRKMVKILIIAFLCNEMHSILPQQRSKTYPSSVNGTEAIQENSKHHASIRLAANDRIFGEGHLCSGALIAPSVVLTVAQCVFNFSKNKARHPSELKVVMGTMNRYQRAEHTLNYGVTHVYQSDIFNPQQPLRNNIAILMLERDIPEIHPTVQPITLNVADTYGTSTACGVTSWGFTKEGLPLTHLMSLNATKLDDQMCSPANAILCIDVQCSNLSLYPSDIGAPLLCRGQLMGLSSNVHDCSVNSTPAVYLDVAYHSKWILDKIGRGTNQNSSIWGTLGFLLFTVFTLKTANLFKL